jgi:hypothetical protein
MLVALLGVGWGQAQVPEIAEAKQVPFELLRSLHMAVDVKIDDAGPYRLIFDLGAPFNLISGRFAAEAGLITRKAAEQPAFFGMRGEKTAKKMQVGDVVAQNVPVMIMDHPTIKAISEVLGPIDGIVGYPFFARYKFTIDYPAATMTYTPTGYKPQSVMNQMFGRLFGARDTTHKRISPNGLWGVELERPASDDGSGVMVSRVWPGGPAADAGLRVDDRILTIAGRWTDSPTEAALAASLADTREPVTLSVRRQNTTLEIQITPWTGL